MPDPEADLDRSSTDRAVLELNARLYHPDAALDPLADLIEQGPAAYAHLPAHVVDLAATHQQLRSYHRQAVAAGVVKPAGTTAHHQHEEH